MDVDDYSVCVTPIQKLGEMVERVEADQGAYAKDLLKKLRKAQLSVKNILASGDTGMVESFDAFVIGGQGGSFVDGIDPMGSGCTPERFWGEVDSWIKFVWNGDVEEAADEKRQLAKNAGLDQSPQTETPQASGAKKADKRTVRARRPEVSAKGGTAAGPGPKSRLMQANGQPTEFARRGMLNGISALPAGVSRKDLSRKLLNNAAGMTAQDEREMWDGEDDDREEEGLHSVGTEKKMEDSDPEGSSENSDSDEGLIEDRPSLRNRAARGAARGEQRGTNVCTIARNEALMFFTITMEQAVESDVIRQNWREFRRKAPINCIDVIKQVLPDEDSDEHKMMLALIHTVTEAETNAGTRKWRVGVIAAKDLAAFQEKMDAHRLNPLEPDGVETADRTVWHVEGLPGYEMVIRLDQMGQQAGKLLGYFIGADSGMLGIKGGDLDKATFISLQVAKALVAERMIPGIEHAQLQFRKATIDFAQGVSATTSIRPSEMGRTAESRRLC